MKHVVGLSGGIDSQAALRWVRNRFGDENVIALNSNAGGNENPLTIEFEVESNPLRAENPLFKWHAHEKENDEGL